MSLLPRWLHRRYAHRHGYFWLPCLLCGRHFGGHEWRNRRGRPAQIPSDRPGIWTGICPKCTRAGRGVRDERAPA